MRLKYFSLSLLPSCLLISPQLFADKLPFNPEFPNASYPYHEAPGGCGSGSTENLIPDNFVLFDFTPACIIHDNCYSTLGSDRGACDGNFKSSLYDICHGIILGRITCIELAETYAAGVRSGGKKSFDNAQNKAASYLKYAKSVIS